LSVRKEREKALTTAEEKPKVMTAKKIKPERVCIKVRTLTDLTYTDEKGNVVDVGFGKELKFLEGDEVLKSLLDNRLVEVIEE